MLILFVFIGCSSEDEYIPMREDNPKSSEPPASVAPSTDEKNSAESADYLEYFLYYRVGEADTLIGSVTFPDDPLYFKDRMGRINPSLLTMSPDENYAILGVSVDNDMEGLCRLFQLNLDTAELTGYETTMKIWPLSNAIIAGGYLYPKRNVEQSENEITYTYYDSKTIQPKGEFIFWDDKLYFTYVSRWHLGVAVLGLGNDTISYKTIRTTLKKRNLSLTGKGSAFGKASGNSLYSKAWKLVNHCRD